MARNVSTARSRCVPPFCLPLFRVLVVDALVSPGGSHQFLHVVAVSLYSGVDIR